MSCQQVPACVYHYIHLECFMHRPHLPLKARLDLSLPMKLYQLLIFPFPSAVFVWSIWFDTWLRTSIISYMQVLLPQERVWSFWAGTSSHSISFCNDLLDARPRKRPLQDTWSAIGHQTISVDAFWGLNDCTAEVTPSQLPTESRQQVCVWDSQGIDN